MPDPPPCLDIDGIAQVPNERKNTNVPIVKMTDGRVYRFDRPEQVSRARNLRLERGYTLDLDHWETHPTAQA